MEILILIMENSTTAPQKIKHRINICSNNPASGYTFKKIKARSQRDIYTFMFLGALFAIA